MLTEESYEARIAGVVRRHLEARFGDWTSFDAIVVVLRTDQWGGDGIHVYVVYDGDGEPLDLRWLSGIRNRMRRELRNLGADVMVTTSYIDRSDLATLLDLIGSPEAAAKSRQLLPAPMDGPLSQGMCNLCQEMVNDLSASAHLIDCVARQGLPRASGSEPTEHRQSLHLSAHDGNGLYWMELAVRADTTLRQLDDFLRGMWLECCGHLSEFTIQGTRYSNLAPHPDDPNAAAIRADHWMDDDEEHMDIAVADVMPEGVEVRRVRLRQYDGAVPGEPGTPRRPGGPFAAASAVAWRSHLGAGPQPNPTRSAWPAGKRRAGGCCPRTPKRVRPYPSATGAGRRSDATSR